MTTITEGVHDAARLRLDRARWWALSTQPFYGALAMNLSDVMDSSVATAATDGRTIRWNPTYIGSLSDEELRFVLLHETLHCAHQHMWRLPCDQQGNDAGDHEINLTLQSVTGVTMPQGGLADPQYADLACEDILARLRKDPPEPPPSEDEDDSEEEDDEEDSDDEQDEQDSGAGDDDTDEEDEDGGSQQGDSDSQSGGDGEGVSDPCGTFTAPAADPAASADAQAQASQDLRDDWDARVMQAAQVAQALGYGDIPADLQRVLDRARHTGVDWRREMADFVKDTMSQRNDWSRASRRHAWQPVIYPRKRADAVGKVIFARDTSGSITDEVCAAFTALITDCISEAGCEGLVLDCDTAIKAEYELGPFDTCPLTAQGYGGTDFRPVFNRADELIAAGEQVAGIVFLTDLDGPAPGMSDIPTLWLSTVEPTGRYYPVPAFGRIVRIEEGTVAA